jgi:hypothetical protein
MESLSVFADASGSDLLRFNSFSTRGAREQCAPLNRENNPTGGPNSLAQRQVRCHLRLVCFPEPAYKRSEL